MQITIEVNIAAPIDEVWKAWTSPADIQQWNAASEDWHCPSAEIDLRAGGKFSYRMEAKDGSMGFDFGGPLCQES
ncbi:SRPBCC domain-containing protein [Cyanobium gracile]|uniref:SRPBCC domain-containing protein n=1 Tax=Cyanobium gracile TaxID=59930 RepID=UPI000A060191|nr:SRPBCC domain-containing protein [Cyanobium gracile]